MKTFFAALAMVSALLVVESKADETARHCIAPKDSVVAFAEEMVKQNGLKVRVIRGVAAQAYLNVVREVAEVPPLPGIELLIIENEGTAALAFVIKGENRCGHITLTWPLHRRALLHAERTNV